MDPTRRRPLGCHKCHPGWDGDLYQLATHLCFSGWIDQWDVAVGDRGSDCERAFSGGGTTGLLGGLSLSALRSDGSMVWKAMQGLHGFVDNAFRAMGIEVNENLHHAIEQEALYIVWTVVFVVMASLIAEWVRSSQARG